MSRYLEKQIAITGIGQSEVGRPSTKTPMRLTVDAALEAIADAGLSIEDIDGLACWPGADNNASGFSPIGVNALKNALGINLNWFGSGFEAPGPLAGVMNAAAAISMGLCRHVLVFRTITEASARKARPGANNLDSGQQRDMNSEWKWYTPFHVYSAINLIGIYATRHFHDFGTTSEQLGQIAINARRNAALNPKAIYRDPITMDDYLASRIISSPLRLLDCDVHCDAATAVVLSHIDTAKDAPKPPIRIEAIGSALHTENNWDQLNIQTMATASAARMMWERTDLKPKDVDTAQIYDGFSILTLMWLEGLGFCKLGEGGSFLEGGHRIALDGELPLNTNGGQMAGGRTHSMGYLHEACLQLRGEAGARQLADPRVAVVAAGGGPLGSALLLVRDT